MSVNGFVSLDLHLTTMCATYFHDRIALAQLRRIVTTAVVCLMIFLVGCTVEDGNDSIAESPLSARRETPVAKKLPASGDFRRDVDLGELLQGDRLQHTFTVHNTTDVPLSILSIEKSCGCETAGLKEGAVIPVRGIVDVPYSAPTRIPGERTARLVLRTDSSDPSLREVTLTLKATVRAQLWVEPTSLDFGNVEPGATPGRESQVFSSLPGLLDRFQAAMTSRGDVTVELQEQSSTRLVFQVRLKNFDEERRLHDLIWLTFNDKTFTRLLVDVHGYVGRRNQRVRIINGD